MEAAAMFWKKSDADYINSIRSWIGWSTRLRVFWAVLSVASLGNVIAIVLLFKWIAQRWDETTWLGFFAGVIAALIWCSFGLALFMFLASKTMRPWKLLIDYHDRLKDAGLLKEGGNNPAEKR